ncbi:cytochrome P450 [Irpex lacteus]|nr:cytochrome P450 [Irpex lacteus]
MTQELLRVVACGGALLVTWLLYKFLVPLFTTHPFDNVPGPSSTETFMTGDMVQLWDRVRGWEFHKHITRTYGSVARLHGPFGSKMLYTYDPKALQEITRRQTVYIHPEWITSANTMILGRGLLSTEGEQHRKQRRLLNPAFTQESINSIYPIFQEVTDRLQEAIRAEVKDGPKEIDVLRWTTRTAFELISQGGLGRSFDPLLYPPEDAAKAFGEALKELVPSLFPINHWRMAGPLAETVVPSSLRGVLAKMLPHKEFQVLRAICDLIYDTGRRIFKEGRSAIEKEGGDPVEQLAGNKDMLSVLLKSSFTKEEGLNLPEEELIAQMGTMLFAATDTTSTLVSRALHALSLRTELQDKLRTEIQEAQAQHGQDLPCEVLLQLPLLEAVVRESLRLFPAVNILPRVAQKDDCLTFSEPIQGKDGTPIKEIIVPKGTTVIISFLASNTNKALWGEDADEWRPERWLQALPERLVDAQIPSIFANTLTFGAGKHSCIGYRFALMSMKVMLVRFIANFKFSLTDRKIVWNFSGVNYPSMDVDDVKSSMILKVEACRSES